MEHVIKKESNRRLLQTLCDDCDVDLYDVVGIIGDSSVTNKKEVLHQVVQDIQQCGKQYIWKQPLFNEYRLKLEEEDYFQLNPVDFEEGVMECVCGSRRTISYQRQTRSADEGFTTFVRCVDCKKSWRNNN